MIKKMTSRERMITALKCGIPDRVPVAPDFSTMIPCKLTGRAFWEVFLDNSPPLWEAYLNAVRHFGTDGWLMGGEIEFKQKSNIQVERKIVSKSEDRITVRETYKTPDGELYQTIAYPRMDSPTPVEKMIKNFKEDFPKIKHIFSDIIGYDKKYLETQKTRVGESSIFGVGIATPGLQIFSVYFEGSLQAETYAMFDEPEFF